ncbi:hypothetical protein JOC74_002086 [Bacillus capparidis]|uniref:Uncharacterized protein n=1 Tax=Bacillus capparidis TaxID=1840411 RepID=A0ABS4CVQ9_9BACI|nr:hypothetical protein [Bacillus capparidis]
MDLCHVYTPSVLTAVDAQILGNQVNGSKRQNE